MVIGVCVAQTNVRTGKAGILRRITVGGWGSPRAPHPWVARELLLEALRDASEDGCRWRHLENAGWSNACHQEQHQQRQQQPEQDQPNVIRVYCGAQHSAAVMEEGGLYVWGSNSCGQLGIAPAGDLDNSAALLQQQQQNLFQSSRKKSRSVKAAVAAAMRRQRLPTSLWRPSILPMFGGEHKVQAVALGGEQKLLHVLLVSR